MKINKAFLATTLLLLVLAISRESHDEWLARQGVEANNRAMFSGDPIAWKAQAEEADIRFNLTKLT